jgi:hypothetical protein
VTVHSQTPGIGDQTLPAIRKNPEFEIDYVPNSQKDIAVLLLFVQIGGLAHPPMRGDTATISGVDYDIFNVSPNRKDGATLKLRVRTQRYDH